MPSLFEKIREKRQDRAKLISDARAILDKAEAEKRELIDDEQQQWDRLMADADKAAGNIERMERQAEAEGEIEARDHAAGAHHTVDSVDVLNEVRQHPERLRDLRNHPRLATELVPQELHVALGVRQSQEDQLREFRQMALFQMFFPRWINQDFRGIGPNEWRALQQDLDVSGGYLVPPVQYMNDILQNIDDATYLRQWATTFTVTNADSMGVPTLEADPADADWTTELATGSEDSTMSFGKRELHPKPLAKRIKVSKKLMRSYPQIEAFVRDRLAYKFGITFEKALLTGAGATGPLGVFTASNDGISTNRDVSTGNTATSIMTDGLIEAKYSIKQAYWAFLRWLFHRDGVKQIAKLKDGNGQYLWRESVRVGEPDRLLGFPIFMSEYAPNTFTASQYVGILGDFRQVWVVDALTLQFQILQELYAETNQVGVIGRLESDGQPVLEEAFARVKLAAS